MTTEAEASLSVYKPNGAVGSPMIEMIGIEALLADFYRRTLQDRTNTILRLEDENKRLRRELAESYEIAQYKKLAHKLEAVLDEFRDVL